MLMALLHNGAPPPPPLCSQISQAFAAFAPRHADPSPVSPTHQRLYLAPPPPSRSLTKCCGASAAGRLRVGYITASASFPESLPSSG